MYISLSKLQYVILIVHSVTSIDIYKSKRVPRGPRAVETVYNANHPPSAENYIPVTVIYDEEDDISVLKKSIESDTKVSEEDEGNVQTSTDDSSTSEVTTELIPETEIANDPPKLEENNPIPKPKGRAIDIDIPIENTGKTLTSIKSNKRQHSRRRLQETKRVKVNKLQPANVENVEKNTEKVALKENTSTTELILSRNSSRYTTFQRRSEQRDTVVPIIDSENYVYAYNGDYHYRYEGGDGTKAFERGELKTVNGESSGTGVVGGFSYKDKDGNDFSLSYTADENGYRPVGAHLPTPPPIPKEIQQALALLATKTTPDPVTDRITKSKKN